MKTKDILIIAGIAAVGWYFYRTSKGLPLFPSGTTATAAPAAPTSTPTSPASTVGGVATDVNSIISGLTSAAGDLGITSPNDNTASGVVDDLLD